MKSYTIPTTLIEGHQPLLTILAPSDTPQLETTDKVIKSENYVL